MTNRLKSLLRWLHRVLPAHNRGRRAQLQAKRVQNVHRLEVRITARDAASPALRSVAQPLREYGDAYRAVVENSLNAVFSEHAYTIDEQDRADHGVPFDATRM